MSVPTGPASSRSADVQAAFASTLVDEWIRCGVVHAVLCPGSRSTPLALALAAQPAVRVHVRLDERSAAFVALGIGLATGGPALVLTTSGTAAAELHAAVVEADAARVPLLVCTADRPPELHDVGASQTIDQTHLYGRAVRWFCDPGVASDASRSTWRSLAARCVAEAVAGPTGPGPVHLNLPFREPLVGDPGRGVGVPPGRPAGAPWHVVEAATAASTSAGAAPSVTRGLVVAGAGCGDPEAVLALATARGWPVLADPRSGARTGAEAVVATADAFLRSPSFASGHLPDLVLVLGERWASKVVNGFVSQAARSGAEVVVVDPTGRWPDPIRDAVRFVRAGPTEVCRAWAEQGGDRDPAWLEGWRSAERSARGVLTDALCAGPLTEPSLAHHLPACLPSGGTLVVSSSMPIRDVESYALPVGPGPRVLANRGANGIDGVVSTAIGVALASSTPTVALVGDLTFLHDASALAYGAETAVDLTVVVADNGGGGIFSFLDQAGALDGATFDRIFGTPQAVDVVSVARGFGWGVTDLAVGVGPAELTAALRDRTGHGGRSVVRVALPSRDENVAIHRRLHEAVVAAVDAAVDAG